MMRIYRLKKKNVLQEKLQKLFPRLFILRKDGAYQSRSLNIIPYRKKLKLRTSDFLSNDNPKRLKFENTSASMNNWKIDILWMLVNLFSRFSKYYVVNLHNLTPLWPGWNSKLIESMQYTQKVWYLHQINQSPTNLVA